MKIAASIIALFMVTISFGQLGISTNYRQDAIWDDEAEEWNVYATDDNGTLFEFNKGMTMFTHTTSTITSTYYIKSVDINEEESKYTMTVTSDVGNEYEMIIDGINNCVAFFYWKDDQYILVRHSIKDSWVKE